MVKSDSDEELLARYVETFDKLDELCDSGWSAGSDYVPLELRIRESEYGCIWRPVSHATPLTALDAFYGELGLTGTGPGRLPALYEKLILSYRWAKVDLGEYRLLPNWPSSELSSLATAIRADKGLWQTLVPNGYIQFGQGPDLDYDPVCFDFRRRQRNGDCRIVKVDHEQILCYSRIKEATEIAPNFRSLVMTTIERAARRQSN